MWNLLLRPSDMRRYFVHGLSARVTPLDLGMPWWSFGAADAVADFVRPDMEVFEYGSGGSTIFLARRAKHITCVEDSKVWMGLVRAEVDKQGLGNVDLRPAPFDFQQAANFKDSHYLRAIEGKSYDVIVVDGMEGSAQVRPDCFRTAEEHVRTGGLIVVDDSWRYSDLKKLHRAKRCEDYKGTGYCRRGVTSTCLFFY